MQPSSGIWREKEERHLPTLFKFLGYYIYFWSGDGREPVHVHVGKGAPSENDTKIWVGEKVKLAHNKGKIPDRDLLKILRLVAQNKERIRKAWEIHFGK